MASGAVAWSSLIPAWAPGAWSSGPDDAGGSGAPSILVLLSVVQVLIIRVLIVDLLVVEELLEGFLLLWPATGGFDIDPLLGVIFVHDLEHELVGRLEELGIGRVSVLPVCMGVAGSVRCARFGHFLDDGLLNVLRGCVGDHAGDQGVCIIHEGCRSVLEGG